MVDLLLGNRGLAALIAFALVLIPAVIIHELGHFLAGKAVKITILEFGIGFPPRIGRLFVWRGTEFTLNWLPLGGFVRPLGEDMVRQKGEDEESLDRVEARERGIENIKAVNEATPLERIFFLSAGAIANLISAFALFIAVGMLGIPGISLVIADVDESSALFNAGLRNNDVIESINGKHLFEVDDFFAYMDDTPVNEPVQIILRRGEEGEVVPISFTPEPLPQPDNTRRMVRITRSEPGAPAHEAGIRGGDLVLRFNGDPINSNIDLIELTNTHVGEEVTLELLRQGETFEATLTPRENPPPNQGAMGIVIEEALRNTDTGIVFQPIQNQFIVQLGFSRAVQYSADQFIDLFTLLAEFPARIAQGNITAAEARPVSIVGISQAGGHFLQESIEEDQAGLILNYIALISIALGLTNLLPLPALDGGRILFVLIEMIRGRPIPPEREGVVHLLGLIFLLSLTVVVIINDIINPITDLIP